MRDSEPRLQVLRGDGAVELDRARLELRRGGQKIDLEPRPFRLLEVLVDGRGRFVSKDELIETVWEGVAVSDTALSTAVKLLRRALGDSARDPRWIESRRGRGYRFIADVEVAYGESEIAGATPPHVGRERLVERLLGRVASTSNGRGRAVLLGGEPGIGKTTIAEKLLQEAESRGFHVWAGHSAQASTTPDFWTWRPIARELLETARGHDEIAPERLAEALEAIESGARPTPDQGLAPVVDALEVALRAIGRRRPVAMLFEDLDTADVCSLRLLDLLLPLLRSLPCLVVGTFRVEGLGLGDALTPTLAEVSRHEWCERVQLLGLGAADAAELAESSTGASITPAQAEALVIRTGGNPFFLREVIDGEGGLEGPAPPAVCDEIRGRLAGLGGGRAAILAAASVIGDVVDAEVLGFVSKRSAEAVDDALAAAHRAALGRVERDGRFHFDRPIVREAVYEGLDPQERIVIHRRMGEAFEEESDAPASIEWMRGEEGTYGDLQDASLGHLKRGFESLGELSPGTTRDELELELQMSLARALARVHGWAGETVEAWQRASELCARTGDSRGEGIVRVGIAAGMLTLGRMDETLARYSDVLKLGQDSNDRILEVAGCIRAVPLLYMGRLEEAASTLFAGLALTNDDDEFHPLGFSEEFCVTLRQWLGWTLFLLGRREEAWTYSCEAVAFARRRDTFSVAYSLVWNAAVALLREDWEAAGRLAEESNGVARRERYPLVVALSTMAMETARGLAGGPAEAKAAADAFVAALSAMGDSGNRSGAGLMLSFLARLQIAAERPDDAQATISLALALSPETGAFFDAELLRLRGEIALGRGDAAEAEADLRAALALAGEQSAASFSMRAATTLAGLLREGDQASEGRALLADARAAVAEHGGLPDAAAADTLLADVPF